MFEKMMQKMEDLQSLMEGCEDHRDRLYLYAAELIKNIEADDARMILYVWLDMSGMICTAAFARLVPEHRTPAIDMTLATLGSMIKDRIKTIDEEEACAQ